MFSDFSKIFFAKIIFLVVCGHWSPCSVIFSSQQWLGRELMKRLESKRKKNFLPISDWLWAGHSFNAEPSHVYPYISLHFLPAWSPEGRQKYMPKVYSVLFWSCIQPWACVFHFRLPNIHSWFLCFLRESSSSASCFLGFW